MEIAIWGTGNKGREVKKICDRWSVGVWAFIDNDKSKKGSLEGIPVLAPDDIVMKPDDDVQIWIATAASEVYTQAKSITDNVLAWKYVEAILRSRTERPLYPEIALEDRNIQNCNLIKDRESMLKKFVPESQNWKMAEIGVVFGDFSELILRVCAPEKLYLIDAWDNERFGTGATVVRDKFREEIAGGKVEIRQGYSTQKLREFASGELDWVYIDTVHDYETTKRELELCAEKVKTDGYICGHDYAKFNVYSRYDYGVYDAVNEFVVNNGWEFVYLTMEKHGLQSFCLRKIGEGRK